MTTRSGDSQTDDDVTLKIPRSLMSGHEHVYVLLDGDRVKAHVEHGRLVPAEGSARECVFEVKAISLTRGDHGPRGPGAPMSQSELMRAALRSRLPKIIGELSDEAIANALGEDDIGCIVALAAPEAWKGRNLSPLAEARLRGVVHRRKLAESAGGMLSVSEVAALLGVSDEAVRKRIRDRQLIAMRRGRTYVLPAIQIRDEQILPGLPQVLAAMHIDNPWMRLDWLLGTDPRLDDERPIDLLQQSGNAERVKAAAAMVGEHGAR